MCPGSSARREAGSLRQLGGRHPRRELQQCEGVPLRLGDDPLSDAAIEPAGHDTRQQCAGIFFGQPIEVDVGQPVEVVPDQARAPLPRSPPTRRARRRATRPMTCAEATSSHCASSTRQSTGRSSATADNRLSTARPTRNRSGTSPADDPSAMVRASLCGAGSASIRFGIAATQLMHPRERQFHLGLDAAELRHPEARRLACGVVAATRSCRCPPRRG